MDTTASVIQKWYEKIGFPKKYDEAFYAALAKIEVSPDATLEAYDKTSEDGIKNLLHYLYFCEETARRCSSRDIPEDILLDTLSDIVIWTDIWSEIKGELYLGEIAWLANHLSGRLFKLGRLQFAIPDPSLLEERGTVQVHIPAVGKLDISACLASIDEAKSFFARYFPEYEYDRFTCDSWLLDETLKKYLPPESNIVRFGDLFTRVKSEDADSLLQYIFRWDTKRETLPSFPATSSLAARIKKAILEEGETFHLTLGYILK
ncbi:MAG: hypothetical protein E7609_00075 [Ruminococcaceae bacterium]|nr:hypothetical protein [Oscillospiraceae bacterium]